MIVGRHRLTTRVLGKPAAWDEAKQGPCVGLPVCDHMTTAGPAMESAWFPSHQELFLLCAGAPVLLGVLGFGHPPVYLAVGDPPDESLPVAASQPPGTNA